MTPPLARDGFDWARGVAPPLPAIDSLEGPRRNALELEPVTALARAPWLRDLVATALGAPLFCVRAILFDKTRGANWGVPWHQDRSIAVRERHDVDGFGPWSTKADIPHTLAPEFVLTRMISTRIHMDDCGPEDGALRVVPGTHATTLTDAEVSASTQRGFTTCLARRGDVLLMRPLLVHSSLKATVPSRRRVLHLEWAAQPLPRPLQWRWTILPSP